MVKDLIIYYVFIDKKLIIKYIVHLIYYHCNYIKMWSMTINQIKRKQTINSRKFYIELGVTVAACIYVHTNYKVSSFKQYLVRTGVMIPKIKISKNGLILPFQKYDFIDMEPKNFKFKLNADSNDKDTFTFEGTFTIGPKNDVIELEKYVLINDDNLIIEQIVNRILDDKIKTLAINNNKCSILRNRYKFKDAIIQCAQIELDKFGLMIYNGNIDNLEFFVKDIETIYGENKISESSKKKMKELNDIDRKKYNDDEAYEVERLHGVVVPGFEKVGYY